MLYEKHIILTEKEIMKKSILWKIKQLCIMSLKCGKYPHCLIYKMNYYGCFPICIPMVGIQNSLSLGAWQPIKQSH